MGLFKKHSSCSTCLNRIKEDAKNPNPNNFKILDYFIDKEFLLVKINYPNATNFEGNKIMLYKGLNFLDLVNSKSIDPHFYEDKFSPIARFVPTDQGWKMGLELIKQLNMEV